MKAQSVDHLQVTQSQEAVHAGVLLVVAAV